MRQFYLIFIILYSISLQSYSKNTYPNLSGEILMESRFGFVNSQSNSATYDDSMAINIEPKFSLNLNKGWSVKSQWKLSPVKDRESTNYEIGNVFPSSNSPSGIGDTGLVIEELKGHFKNNDLSFYFGKYNPTFGKAWEKKNRIGVFVTDFTEDYELTEKLGTGMSALMGDDNEISLNLFFNDTTGLSNSAINKRGKNKSSNNIAGNNTNLSSYSITFAGVNLFGVEDLEYNFGYRDLDVDNQLGYDNEKGFVGGLKYSIPISSKTFFVPMVELVKINNFNGIDGQDVLYLTTAIKFTHRNWHAGLSNVTRDVERSGNSDFTDSQTQYFVGYKFNNDIAIDIAHMNIEENKNKAKIVGLSLSYLYGFK
jgi:hypothetical protein